MPSATCIGNDLHGVVILLKRFPGCPFCGCGKPMRVTLQQSCPLGVQLCCWLRQMLQQRRVNVDRRRRCRKRLLYDRAQIIRARSLIPQGLSLEFPMHGRAPPG